MQSLRAELSRQRAVSQDLVERQRAGAVLEELQELRSTLREVSAAKRALEDDLERLRRQRVADECALNELRHRAKYDGDGE